MNEASFKRKVYNAVRHRCYVQAMSDRLRPGMPDHWYSGNKADLWIEYKWDPKSKLWIKPDLSALQQDWLNNRYDEGRNVAVIVATSSKTGVLFRDKTWNDKKSKKEEVDFKTIINFILKEVSYEV